jgi:hypothetical protein
METKEPDVRTRAAIEAARVAAARRRFGKWKNEMEAWGCAVDIPDALAAPKTP